MFHLGKWVKGDCGAEPLPCMARCGRGTPAGYTAAANSRGAWLATYSVVFRLICAAASVGGALGLGLSGLQMCRGCLLTEMDSCLS